MKFFVVNLIRPRDPMVVLLSVLWSFRDAHEFVISLFAHIHGASLRPAFRHVVLWRYTAQKVSL